MGAPQICLPTYSATGFVHGATRRVNTIFASQNSKFLIQNYIKFA